MMRQACYSIGLLPVLLLPLLLGACATDNVPEADSKGLLPSIESALDEGLTPPAPRSEAAAVTDINAALLPQINLNLPGRSGIDTEPRFDIKVNRVRARQFFMGLVDGTPYNMVLDPRVKGRITLDLKNVTVREVMETVRDTYGYDFEVTRNGFRVFPNEMTTRIYHLNYLDIQRKGRSQVRVNSGQLTDARTAGRGGRVSGGIGGSSGTGSSGQGRRQAQASSQIDTVTDSKFWSELNQSLQAIVGSKEGRKVVVSPQSGVVVVRALPHELRTVERYLNATQNIMQRQVILEAKIIEVNLSDKFQAGINWSALASSRSGNNSGLISHVGGGSVFDLSSDGVGFSSLSGNSGDLNPALPSLPNGSSTSAFGGVFTFALTLGNDFTAFLELLKGQGEVQVLSSPKISTLNNTKAVIKVGQDEFFVTDVGTNTAITSGTSSTSNNVELTPFFSGVALDVVPQIDGQGNVTLFIHPSVSQVDEQNKTIALAGSDTLVLPLAFSTIRESDTIIRAKSGQVVVIGGLMQDKTTDVETSVPVLGNIPLLGGLFRHKQEVTRKSELVILLKPIVVDGDNIWTDAVRQSRDRIRDLRAAQ
jgi:MSHA biogenesis protein MshL